MNLEKAIKIAVEAHMGQVHKGDNPNTDPSQTNKWNLEVQIMRKTEIKNAQRQRRIFLKKGRFNWFR